MPHFQYASEPELPADEFIDVLRRSTLAERRPVDELERIAVMLKNASVVITARNSEGMLVGVSRAITDFAFCTYLSDLAVDVDYQRQGIGKRLIKETHLVAGKKTRLILLSAPAAESYYPHIGMIRHHSCWQILPSNLLA
jgi:ribosomal protein S18 acetylase RimI-like enzyme